MSGEETSGGSSPAEPWLYPEGHGPTCPSGCDHPIHERYDAWVEARERAQDRDDEIDAQLDALDRMYQP